MRSGVRNRPVGTGRARLTAGRATRSAFALVWLALAGWPTPGMAEEPDRSVTPPRLAFLEGEVSFWRPGAEDWTAAAVNIALEPGDRIYAAQASQLELQIGAAAWVRAGAETTLGLDNLEAGFIQFRVTDGRVVLDLRRVPNGLTVEVDTPNAALTVDRAGYYRVDIGPASTAFVARRDGQATVLVTGEKPATLDAGEEIVVGATGSPLVDRHGAPAPDGWDGWNEGRSDRILRAGAPSGVQTDLYGVEELGRYGTWEEAPTYGRIWVPSALPPDWSPYSTGRWMWDPYYGWTWVDNASWGWAPYHYGRWVFVGRHWAWAPGPILGPPLYAPALVAFLDYRPHAYVALQGPSVAWVALGWGEPLVPWWGPVGFIDEPWWGGWYGPRVVNRVVIHHTTIVHHHDIRDYEHGHHGHGVVAVPHDHFRRGGRIEPSFRVAAGAARHLSPLREPIRIRPSAQGLVPEERPGRRPASTRYEGPVVATRPARDPSQPLHDAGLRAPHGEQAGPTRLVEPSRAGQPDHTGTGQALPHPLARERFEQRRSEHQEAVLPPRPASPPHTSGAREPAVTHPQPGSVESRPEPPAPPRNQPRERTRAGSHDEVGRRGGTFSPQHREQAPRVEPPPPPHSESRPAPDHSYSPPAPDSGSRRPAERRENLRSRNPDDTRQPAPAPPRAQRPERSEPSFHPPRERSSEPFRHEAPEIRRAPAQPPVPQAEAGPRTSGQGSPHSSHQERIDQPNKQ